MATPTTLPATFVAGNVLTAAEMNDLRGAFRVLQVVEYATTAAGSQSITTTYADLGSFSATITPQSTSNKVLVLGRVALSGSSGIGVSFLQILRDATAIGIGDTAGTRTRYHAGTFATTGDALSHYSVLWLDSPATTSAITYKYQIKTYTGTYTAYWNRSTSDTDGIAGRTASNLILMEISA